MEETIEHINKNRSKIYEKLDYKPMPENYSSNIPWVVQQQISATNGIHYIDRIGKLKEYPIYNLPVASVSKPSLFLDIGCGWGRWLVAASNKGYTPIGIDIRLEFAMTARTVLKDLGINGYTVVADLENIPFQDNIFDLVWSFSVIQHTHYKRLTNCLQHINRIITDKGFTKLEFPNKNGLRNRISNVPTTQPHWDDYNSWCVRYYTPNEYKEIIEKYLSNFSYSNHSFLGIGVLKEDLKYVSAKNKMLCLASLLGSSLTNIFPSLANISDSLYIQASKNKETNFLNKSIQSFFEQHKKNPTNNLNIVSLLRCPKYGGRVELSSDNKKVISQEAGIYYPIENDIPIMISSEASSL